MAMIDSDITATRPSTNVQPSALSQTYVSQLIARVAGVRDGSRMLHEDASELHHMVLNENLDLRTAVHARRHIQELLAELRGRGFSWSMIARLVGVTVPAVRKWRGGETASGENRRRLAHLCAVCDYVESDYLIDDVVSWMEVPITANSALTPVEMYRLGREDLVLDWAGQRLTATQVLDSADPSWRERAPSPYEVFLDDDGEPALRRRH
jgi:hypothetical protein